MAVYLPCSKLLEAVIMKRPKELLEKGKELTKQKLLRRTLQQTDLCNSFSKIAPCTHNLFSTWLADTKKKNVSCIRGSQDQPHIQRLAITLRTQHCLSVANICYSLEVRIQSDHTGKRHKQSRRMYAQSSLRLSPYHERSHKIHSCDVSAQGLSTQVL